MISAITGFLLVRALSSGPRGWCRHDFLRLLLGAGLGVGLSSCCYFLGLLSQIPGAFLELLLLVGAGVGAFLRRKNAKCPLCQTPAAPRNDRLLTSALAMVFFVLLMLDGGAFIGAVSRAPNGQWDAWAIWNMRARFLYRDGGAVWRDGFTELMNWSHPDYPLLVPAFVASVWRTLGRETRTVPIALSAFFSFGSAGLMATSVSILRGARQGYLAGLVLAATPALYLQGASQYADVPLAFFVLATLVTATLADRHDSIGFSVLAGTMATLAGWTKNEGLQWFGCFFLAWLIVNRSRRMAAFLAGAAPVLAVILLFKTQVATSSDIVGTSGRIGMMRRLLDISRYELIIREGLVHVWNFGPLVLSPFVILAVFLAVVGVRPDARDRRALQICCLALALTIPGYFMVYVLRSLDLAWLLRTSLNRLILQIWPGIVFAVFLAARTAERHSIGASPLVRALSEAPQTNTPGPGLAFSPGTVLESQPFPSLHAPRITLNPGSR